MSPEIYMCYIISTKKEFKDVVRIWRSEFKAYYQARDVTMIGTTINDIRRIKKSDWNNFDLQKLLKFMDKHLRWTDD